jgi:hypothetical protein
MAGYSAGLMIDDKPRIVLMRGLFFVCSDGKVHFSPHCITLEGESNTIF